MTNVVDVHVNAFMVVDDTIQGELRYQSELTFWLYFAVLKTLFSAQCHFNLNNERIKKYTTYVHTAERWDTYMCLVRVDER